MASTMEVVEKKRKRNLVIEPIEFVNQLKTCPYCDSHECRFLFLNNGKANQPRYQCLTCKEKHTHVDPQKGTNGRPRGRKYRKKKHIDPLEWQGVDRTCTIPSCGVQNNASFLYYNNQNKSQPRFLCHNCGNEFQLWPKRQRTSLNQDVATAHQVDHVEENTSEDSECSSYATFLENALVEDTLADSNEDGHDMDMQENANEEEFTTYTAFLENELVEDPPTESTGNEPYNFEDMQQVGVVLEENTSIQGDCDQDIFFQEDWFNEELPTTYVVDCKDYASVFNTIMHGENNEVVFV